MYQGRKKRLTSVLKYADAQPLWLGNALDYDDALAVGVTSSNGVLFTFTHSGSIQGWSDRWLEGGSNLDSWNRTGNNPSIKENWTALSNGWTWQGNAQINVDINSVVQDVENAAKAVQTIVQVVEVVADLLA